MRGDKCLQNFDEEISWISLLGKPKTRWDNDYNMDHRNWVIIVSNGAFR
jgi:hypothetical protein